MRTVLLTVLLGIGACSHSPAVERDTGGADADGAGHATADATGGGAAGSPSETGGRDGDPASGSGGAPWESDECVDARAEFVRARDGAQECDPDADAPQCQLTARDLCCFVSVSDPAAVAELEASWQEIWRRSCLRPCVGFCPGYGETARDTPSFVCKPVDGGGGRCR